MSARYIVGDVRDVLASIPDASVDLVLTSPPFLALRSYLPADHPDKHREIGSEATPGAFIDTLLELTEEFARVLTPHGSLCLELGDTYSGARGYGNEESQNPAYGDRSVERWQEARVEKRFKKEDDGWPEAKSLCLIPELYRISLVYGRNPLTGRETPRWRARNVVRWCRPNPPVGALGDKFRPATSEMVVACKSARRWFDLDAVREPTEHFAPGGLRKGTPHGTDERRTERGETANMTGSNPAGAPPLDWWNIPTQAYRGSHYASWPERLCVRPILSMCPQRVCRACGEPSRRIVEKSPEYAAARDALREGDAESMTEWSDAVGNRAKGFGTGGGAASLLSNGKIDATPRTVGWTDCEHDAWRAGVTLDPFAGSGTTLAVASGHGRDCIGVDLDARNAELALERVGPLLLTVEHFTKENVA